MQLRMEPIGCQDGDRLTVIARLWHRADGCQRLHRRLVDMAF